MTNFAFSSSLSNAAEIAARRFRDLIPSVSKPDAVSGVAEVAARVGYGARGSVYVSVGGLALLSALDLGGRLVGTRGVAIWLAQQPFGRVWLVALGLGLLAFVAWRILQSVFDADREGNTPRALLTRAGQAMSGLFYGLLAAGVFELLDEVGSRVASEDVGENREKAAILLALPFGDLLLMAVAVVIAGVGVGNILKGVRSDFADTLACSPKSCDRLSILARAGYVARGFAYLPLAVLVGLAGWHTRAAEVTDMAGSFQALQDQPGGSILLTTCAGGLIAFGGFAFVEARFRRIRAPRALS